MTDVSDTNTATTATAPTRPSLLTIVLISIAVLIVLPAAGFGAYYYSQQGTTADPVPVDNSSDPQNFATMVFTNVFNDAPAVQEGVNSEAGAGADVKQQNVVAPEPVGIKSHSVKAGSVSQKSVAVRPLGSFFFGSVIRKIVTISIVSLVVVLLAAGVAFMAYTLSASEASNDKVIEDQTQTVNDQPKQETEQVHESIGSLPIIAVVVFTFVLIILSIVIVKAKPRRVRDDVYGEVYECEYAEMVGSG